MKDLGAHRVSVYGFSHGLFQEYLYDHLDGVERSHLHDRVGTAMEQAYGTDEMAHKVALHFEHAAAADKAIHYWRKASDRAKGLTANTEAISHLNRALALVLTLPASHERDKIELGLQVSLEAPLAATQGWASPEIRLAAERALELAEAAAEDAELLPVLFQLATFEGAARSLDSCLALAARMLRLANRLDDTVQSAESGARPNITVN